MKRSSLLYPLHLTIEQHASKFMSSQQTLGEAGL